MVPPVDVLAIATAVPPHKLEQRAVANAAREVYARTFTRYPKLARRVHQCRHRAALFCAVAGMVDCAA